MNLIMHHAMSNIPIPLLIVDNEGIIVWSNSRFLERFDEKDILSKKVQEIIPQLNVKDIKLQDENTPIKITHKKKTYDLFSNKINVQQSKDNSDKYKIILSFIDKTEYIDLKNKYEDIKVGIGLIYIDNYEDIMYEIDETKKSTLLAEIDKILNSLSTDINAIIKRMDRDKYIMIFENRYFKDLLKNNFNIIDKIKNINVGNNIPVTLSIGIGRRAKTLDETYEYSRAAMDIALGRGGDQVVVKDMDNLSFYGGKSKTVEKRTKVKARIIAYALKQIINQSDTVFIMGHTIPDMDSFGASIGMYRAIKNRGKKCYIILNSISESIKNIYERLEKEQSDYLEDIVQYEKVRDMSFKSSLCIVVDTHIPEQTESLELLNKIDKVVVIDHHRRGESFIENPMLTYLEPYASSASELVSEILYYIEDNIYMTKFDATALLAGIAVDTKNFAINTGVRTFEAASFLRKKGANTEEVRQLFENDMDSFMLKGEIMKNISMFKEGIAISKLEKDNDKSVLVAAQVADEILNIKGVIASFVLAKINDKVHISGRSTEDMSVQLILEKVGGGGHMTVAGAKINSNMVDAENMLKNAITEYLEESVKK